MKLCQFVAVIAIAFIMALFAAPLWAQTTFSDNFNDGVIDSTVWKIVTEGNSQVIEESGYVKLISRTGGAVNHSALVSKYQIFGDFEVEIDYALVNFPGGDNRFGFRLSKEKPSFWYQYYFHRWSASGYELICNWGDSTGPRGNVASIYQLILNGKLRLVRKGNTFENYYWQNNSWQKQGSLNYAIDGIYVMVFANTDVNFPPYECHFDNFKLIADSLAIPRGTGITKPPQIISIKDVPNDQGGKVTVKWKASCLDTNVIVLPFYSLWRALPEGKQVQGSIVSANKITKDFNGPAYRIAVLNGKDYAWEWLANQPAHRFASYTYTAATLYDSTSTTDRKHYFLVSAHTSDPNIFYDSQPDSGYSVDNLAPLAPRNLAAKHDSGRVILQWDANTEPDLRQYVLYRSASPNINPDRIQPFATITEARFIDANPLPGNSFYIVRAQDIHDNLSPKSNEAAFIRTGVAERNGEIPKAFALYQNHPNPFNPTTSIGYELPSLMHVSLAVFNLKGEQVHELVGGVQPAGRYVVEWDGRDAADREVASGIYFYRLKAGSMMRQMKMTLLRQGF